MRKNAHSFVADSKGNPIKPLDKADRNYTSSMFFSVGDIFQGDLGSCFWVATAMGLLRNKEILAHVIPADNTSKANMNAGVYHFRFWKLGNWYDLVVDDFLLVDQRSNHVFTRNLTYPGEFWICLFEKAFAK